MKKIYKVILVVHMGGSHGRALLHGFVKYRSLRTDWEVHLHPLAYLRGRLPIKEWNADGLIVQSPTKVRFPELRDAKKATMVFSEHGEIPGLNNILIDHYTAGQMAAQHLLERNFRHYAHLGLKGRPWSQQHREGFRTTILEAGFRPHLYSKPALSSKRFHKRQLSLLVDWLKFLPKPVGLAACNDEQGEDIIVSGRTAGLDIPGDTAVIGADNDEFICELCSPTLSSIQYNTERIGYEAAKLLDDAMQGLKKINTNIFISPTHVVSRQSTDTHATQCTEINQALRFIRAHAGEGLGVTEVAEHVCTSRRGLERQFRKLRGSSVHAEISRVRAEHIVRLLLETRLSIGQIAQQCRFSNIGHMSRFFRQQKGMSPVAYRKKYGPL